MSEKMEQTKPSEVELSTVDPSPGKTPEIKESAAKNGLTKAQRKCLLDSWNRMQDGSPESVEDVGRRLVMWMFENIDGMFKLFFSMEKRKPRIQQWFEGRTNLGDHFIVVGNSFNKLIHSVDDNAAFSKNLTHIVDLHLCLETPIGCQYFNQFQEKIPSFVMRELDVASDSNEVVAWQLLAEQFYNKSAEIGGSDEDCVRRRYPRKNKCCTIL